MAYFSLYRRRRPLKFADMTGQEHITRTLSNALCNERLAHAYLFCGPRGTGKTTAAKILSKAMNCEHYPVAEPCGLCVPCKNIAAGVSIDVIEMDAASNRGIDEIRELRERSRFASGESRFKVYIIDEAHMLTTEACNAFLKTLEEPPQNVVFILATTDPSRLPSTIVSRCQRFDFHLLTVEQIKRCLEQILQQENWQAESEALTLIARLADGSLRDALGILEQCSAYGEEQINAEQVRVVTGATLIDVIETLVKAAVDNDLDAGLAALEQVVFSGRDLNLFMRDLTFVFTRLLLDSGSPRKPAAVNLHGFEEVVSRYHGKIERHLLLDAVELLHEVSGELRKAHFPQYILEVAFIRLVRLLHGRIKPASVLYSEPTVQGEPDPVTAKPEAPITSHEEPPEAATCKEHAVKLKQAWPRLLQEIKRRQKSTAAWLDPAVLSECRGHMVYLHYSSEYTIHQIRIMEESHRKTVEEVLSSFCGEQMKIKAEITQGPGSNSDGTGREGSDPVLSSPLPANDLEQKAASEVKPEDEAGSASSADPAESAKRKTPQAEAAAELFGGKFIESD